MPQSVHEQLALERAAARRARLSAKREQHELASLRGARASLRLDLALSRVRRALGLKYRPDQPRVPAGNPDGGQWTDDDSDIPRVLVDRAQWASGRSRAPTRVLIAGRWQQLTPGQSARLALAEARARDALARIGERDPNWRPTPFIAQGVEAHIRGIEGEAREAQARFRELQRAGIGPGPFAAESIPARGPERDFTAQERRAINRIGRDTGCHTCGTTEPGTRRDNFVPDHQLPNSWNSPLNPQRLFPQCLSCSARQGNWLRTRGR